VRFKKKYVYGDLVKEFRPTIRSLLLQLLQEKLFTAKRSKQSIYNEGSVFIPQTDKFAHLPLKYLALIQEGIVVEMIRVNVDSAEVLASKKTEFVEFDPKEVVVKKGMSYNGEQFTEDNVSN
jgi:hypothetical protein